MKGPVSVNDLRNDVKLELEKTETKLRNQWYPEILRLFVAKNTISDIRPEMLDSFYNCVSVLLSNQVPDLSDSDIGSFPFVPPPTPQYVMRPPVTGARAIT